jgi:integrase
MPPRITITAKTIPSLTPPAKGNRRHPVANCPGLFLCITAVTEKKTSGSKSWQFRYVNAEGRERLYTIGPYPEVGLMVARDRWKELRREVALGGDPLGESQATRRAPTVGDLAARYLETVTVRKCDQSRYSNRTHMETVILPALGKHTKVEAVELADVDAMHHRLAEHPIKANRMLALCSHMFNMAEKWGWREGRNPCRYVERFPEERRERFLSLSELGRLAETLDAWHNQTVADACRWLVLTGCRRNEALTMRWEDVDLERHVWTKPGHMTKTGKLHTVPLSPAALELLSKRERTGPLVFEGRGGGLCHLKNSWPEIRKAAGLEGVRLHDLRHSFASLLASGGGSLPMIGALLGHSEVATTQRYSHLSNQPLQEAVDRVGEIFTSASREPAKVVKLRAP